MSPKQDELHFLLKPLKQSYLNKCIALVDEQNLHREERIGFFERSKLDDEDTKRDHPYLVLHYYPSDKNKLPVLRWRCSAARYEGARFLPMLEDGVSVDSAFLYSDLPICPKTEKAARKLFESKAKLLRKMRKAICAIEANLLAAEMHADSFGKIHFNEDDFDIIEELESYCQVTPRRKKTPAAASIISASPSL